MAVKIITPAEVRKARFDYIPEIIFEAFNKLIIEKFDGKESIVLQDDILSLVCNEDTSLTKDNIFKKHYLDVEDYYRDKGWKVEYDKPAYCENYKAFFKFTAVD